MRRRSALVLVLEPFVLAAVGLAALFFFFSTLAQRGLPRSGTRRALPAARVLQGCAVPCIAVAVLIPSLGPVALLWFFGLSLVVILRLK